MGRVAVLTSQRGGAAPVPVEVVADLVVMLGPPEHEHHRGMASERSDESGESGEGGCGSVGILGLADRSRDSVSGFERSRALTKDRGGSNRKPNESCGERHAGVGRNCRVRSDAACDSLFGSKNSLLRAAKSLFARCREFSRKWSKYTHFAGHPHDEPPNRGDSLYFPCLQDSGARDRFAPDWLCRQLVGLRRVPRDEPV
jgi:hypothetical protein